MTGMDSFSFGEMMKCRFFIACGVMYGEYLRMLVLSRKEDESIVIGDDNWVVTVVDINEAKGVVKLGFTIPGEIPVHRHEVWVALQNENKQFTDAHAARIKQESGNFEEETPPSEV